MPVALRPRSSAELLDAAFQFLRGHYVTVVAASAVILLPLLVLRALAGPEVEALLSFVQNLLFNYAVAATVVMVSDFLLDRGVDLRRALSAVSLKLWPIFAAGFVQGFVLLAGLVLLVVPAFVFFAWTFAMPIVVMTEDCPWSGALHRSRELARGEVWRILRTLGVAYLIFFVVALGAGVLLDLASVYGRGGTGELVDEVLLILVYPFPAVVATLLYYDLRIRKEALDVEMMMRDAPAALPGAVAG